MNKKIGSLIVCGLLGLLNLSAQQVITGDKHAVHLYTEQEIVDPDYGIIKYDKMNFQIGGDSIRNARKGYACQGWVEDNYTNSQVLHRGYYVDGQLRTYKNFFDNGQLEREFKSTDLKRATLSVHFKDGKPKSEIEYYDGCAVKEQDYFANGKTKYYEEHTKNMEYLLEMNYYTSDGKPVSLFNVTDKKKKMYYKKEYYENGKLKEEGPMHFLSGAGDYVKEGSWKFYNEDGSLKSTEQFVNGQGGAAQ